MDAERFDVIARSWAGGASRRRVLGSLIGGLAAGLGLRRARAVPVACASYGRVCRPGQCCAGGAECRCYQNGHCRCLCAGASRYDAATGACLCPGGGEPCPGAATAVDGCCPQGLTCQVSEFPFCGVAP